MEVNPFHNGHKYFLSQIKKSENDVVVAIISTTISQRGEFSVLPKKVKAKLLLDNNVDIVIALPSIFANQGGYYFAYHSLRILKEFKIDTLYFGSETSQLDVLEKYKTIEYDDFKNGINNNLNKLQSNDILGISYLKAIDKLKMNVEVKLIKRVSNLYNQDNLTGEISSATSIRTNINNKQLISGSLPKYSLDNMLSINEDLLFKILKSKIICVENNVLLSEQNQLVNKLLKYINEVESIEQLIRVSSDKNNSKHKLRRIVTNIILDVREENYQEELNYIQILGFKKRAQVYLKDNKLFVTSLKNVECYSCEIEKRATEILKIISNYNSNDDYNKPIIEE